MRKILVAAFGGAILAVAALIHPAAADAPPTLVGRAILPADSFAGGPASGAQITPPVNNGRRSPFGAQPIQGVSAIIDAGGGSYWIMPDNGYGAKNNSADFLLRLYQVKFDFKTAKGGSGGVSVLSYIQFSDPNKQVSWPIVYQGTWDRPLTGADFDIESIRQDRNGDFWVGDEFGPFILHFDSMGKLLQPPFALAGVRSPDYPIAGSGPATLPSSRGFEGMAITPNGQSLIATLEGALTADSNQSRRYFYQFDIAGRSYTGKTWQYRMDDPSNSFGDVTAWDDNRLLIIERDQNEGPAAKNKKIYVVDLRQTDSNGFLVKKLVVDLMNISDPNHLSSPGQPGDLGIGDPFTFPFTTIESVLPLDEHTLLVANDNNYPFSQGRHANQPDPNEFILLRVDIP